MSQLALAHDSLLPRSPGGQGPGAALSMVVHVGLIAALTASIDWRTQTPEVFSAEIWASVPQAAAPAPVAAPPPAPVPAPAPAPVPIQRTAPPPAPDADIAIEHERKRRAVVAERELAERKKAEADRKLAEAERLRLAEEKKQAEQQAREAKAEDQRLARQREENLRRMMGQAGSGAGTTAAGTGTAAQSAGPSATYAGKVIAAVRPHIVFPGNVPGNAAAEVEVRAAAGGSIISTRIVKKSGHEDWDTAVLRAIDKTGSLPRDSDGRVPTTIVIVFRRE